MTATGTVLGMRRLRKWKRIDWEQRYTGAVDWSWPRHLVIIPNYQEDERGLRATLSCLAAQKNAGQLQVLLAMEDREQGGRAKAERLIAAFRGSFAGMFATYHPSGLPGEAPGKGSNEAWAARIAYQRLIVSAGDDIRRYTVTSCDADAQFHPHHFSALNYLFLTDKDRTRAFWQPAILNNNNVWEIPPPLRITEGLSGVNKIATLMLPTSVTFPTSCYSLSWEMLHEVGYWDEEVIPEDWHIYLKCTFSLGDRVHVVPIFLPVGNDCVMAGGALATMRARYRQAVRHAWGSSDIPYAWRAALSGQSPAGLRRRLLVALAVTKVHVFWASQWSIITLGWTVPALLTNHAGANMPDWWLARNVTIPAPGWSLRELLAGQPHQFVQSSATLSIVGAILYFCIIPLLVLIACDLLLRGPKPKEMNLVVYAAQPLIWFMLGLVTLVFSCIPGWHAQIRLATGRGLVYRVAEKGSRRHLPLTEPALPNEAGMLHLPLPPADPLHLALTPSHETGSIEANLAAAEAQLVAN